MCISEKICCWSMLQTVECTSGCAVWRWRGPEVKGGDNINYVYPDALSSGVVTNRAEKVNG